MMHRRRRGPHGESAAGIERDRVDRVNPSRPPELGGPTFTEACQAFLRIGAWRVAAIEVVQEGRKLDPQQIAELNRIGFVETLPNGNLRVTDKGWPVLDAVVADLAA